MANDDTTPTPETREAARARLLWDDLPGTGPGGDGLADHLWDGLGADEQDALTAYAAAVWEAAQLDMGQKALPMEVTHNGRGAWGTAVTLVSTDPDALLGADKGTILAVLR